MNVLILGATGYLGTAIDEALVAHGHRTTGIARSDAAREKLLRRGTSIVTADAAKPATLDKAIREADAVVYAVRVTDADPVAVDTAALRAIRRGLAGTEKTFVFISNAWVYGPTGDGEAAEDAPVAPPALVARRLELERATLEMTKLGVRALTVRPGIAYGRGGGIAAMFVQSAHERGAATIVGNGKNRWATIEIGDLGEFVALAIERGRPGRAYNAASDDRFTVEEIAVAASRGAGTGGKTSMVDARLMGQLGECLALDQALATERAKTDLEWQPRGVSILQDVEFGSYKLAAQVA